DHDRWARRSRRDARALPPPVRCAQRAGDRRRPALVRGRAHREHARRARVRGRQAPAAGRRRPGALMATGTDSEIAPARPKRGGRRLRDGAVIYWWLEIVMILGYYFVYSAIRNTNKSDPSEALHNARTIIGWEKHLGIFHEARLEHWVLHVKAIVIACNYYYG